MKKIFLLLSVAFALFLNAMPVEAKVRYVKAEATGDGSSWTSAMGSLQAAINESAAGDEIWVAAGTYAPEELIKSTKPLSRAFILKSGVSIYGGFAGTETDKAERVLKEGGKPYDFVNETILSADDDVADTWVREFQDATTYRYAWQVENGLIPGTKNNYNHVLYAADEISDATEINGLTLKGANANDYKSKAAGGALYAKGNITLKACKVVENSAWFKVESTVSSDTEGGAVYLDGIGNAAITDCYFARNYSHSSYGRGLGGAVYAKNVAISNCLFEDCVALEMGGAVHNIGGTVTGCEFLECYGGSGGAIYNEGTAAHNVIYDCRGLLGGGIFNKGAASYNLVANCYADMLEMGDGNGGKGGGIYNESGDVLGSVVFNNTAFAGGGIYVKGGRVINSTVQNNMLRAESEVANIGFENSGDEASKVFNTIGNPNADKTNFTNPTTFCGAATTAADTLAVKAADWTLAAGSEFVDAGTLTEGVVEETDINGNPRVTGDAIDKGAYEREAEKQPNIILTFAEAGTEVTVGTGGSAGVVYHIDWGDGVLQEYSKASYITHTTTGNEVKVYGDNLLILAVTNQNLKAVDITRAPMLSRIQLGGNQLTELDVTQNTNLTGIYCEKNKITSLDVKNCKSLRVLDCHENEIAGTIDCSEMTKLTKVDCADNKVEELLLPKHENITQVDCSRNNLTALDVTGMTALIDLSCTENKIASLDLKDLANLVTLYAFSNNMAELDVTPCVNLLTLSVSDNKFTTIDLQKNTLLEGVYLFKNQLTSIDLSKCPNVKWLNISDNNLTELNTSKQTKLSTLIANNNSIGAVDLANNKQLLQIHLAGNQLTAIDVSNQPNLSWLKVDGNMIDALDVQSNGYLYWLECGKNNIAELNLSKNQYLQRLEAGDNKLTTLDLSNNKNLEGVLIQNNQLPLGVINAIIEGLKDVSGVEINVNNETWGRRLNISGMPGTAGANIADAEAKGWIVTAEITSSIDSANSAEEGVTRYYFTVGGHALGSALPSVKGIYIVKEMNGTKVVSVKKTIVK
ncbi:MAG: choice-of-anchor Q domain-containing protein [Prevotella sp.]|uniref:leucine-rich repeat domain-containing protein n=1 Tax=Prevotella sp. TaxID=59823 RepID=UPI002A2801BC|nr:choice-of-anchor Q domain-containing protein [Prevotella sp.]MDD7319121.1 choice-of-anchor Q domain-containing protein [Prevotellaceae bacterium]MDY4019604.1 choice-of-anchor Q domain-containing protein [Prevotella sp.]